MRAARELAEKLKQKKMGHFFSVPRVARAKRATRRHSPKRFAGLGMGAQHSVRIGNFWRPSNKPLCRQSRSMEMNTKPQNPGLDRWLDWTPEAKIFEKLPDTELAKPTQPGFEGFVGSGSEHQTEIPLLEDVLKGLAVELYLLNNERLFIVADEADAKMLGERRGMIYTAAEVRQTEAEENGGNRLFLRARPLPQGVEWIGHAGGGQTGTGCFAGLGMGAQHSGGNRLFLRGNPSRNTRASSCGFMFFSAVSVVAAAQLLRTFAALSPPWFTMM
jgi:hypothetical protein